jgi:hypothetical protein
MKKLVIQTQYKENYAAWDWDGQGECPQGWKFKGGTTYVMPNCAEDIDVDSVVEAISSHITVSNDHTAEYIISADVVDYNKKVCEDWETTTEFTLFSGKPGQVTFMKVTDNRDMGYMRSEILEKIETWTAELSGGYLDRENYSAEFLMEDGDFCRGNAELTGWVEAQNEVA